MRTLRLSLALACLLPAFELAARPASAEVISFNRDIRPIYADVCYQCHGPDPGSRQAELRLDREESLFGEEHDKLIVRGKPEDSELYQRITSGDADEVMPPPTAHRQLKPEQKELIRRWIAEGATWQPHWSFIPPQRPPLPTVKDTSWVRNPIDRFVLAKLEAAGLKPAPELEPATLCRRVYLDLTGLPPTPEEVEEFVSNFSAGNDEKIYETLIDKLLDSPRYGEHRGRYWLDAARYADTHGIHFDNYREIWPYRDWVIRAFNRNQPFDEFSIEQIAGDLFPHPTDEQRIATGFHRCNVTTNEGGTIADENLANYARDRVETTAWVWLGLTANCCVCHDHKFDPITMRDFYSMSAFFRNTTQGSHDGNIKDSRPVMFLPQPEDTARYQAIGGELAATRDTLKQRQTQAEPAITAWQKTVQSAEVELVAEQLVMHAPLAEGSGSEISVTLPEGSESRAVSPTQKAVQVAATGPLEWRKDGKLGPAAVLAGGSAFDLGDIADFERDQPFTVSLWVRPSEKLNDGILLTRTSAQGATQGWELQLQQGGKLTLALHSGTPKATARATTRNPAAKAGNWIHLAATYDGLGKSEGIQLFTNGAPAEASRQGALEKSIRVAAPLLIGQNSKKGSHLTDAAIQDVRIYGKRLIASEVKTLAKLHEARADAAVPFEKRNPQQKARLARFYLENLDAPYTAAADRVQQLEDEQRAIQARATVTHVQEDKMSSPAMANILVRGQYDKLGDKVTPEVFAALNPLPASAPKNRLGLAQWLVDSQNPLTARVTVNRYWQEVFGAGIVRTAEDFGIMGEAPSHPELLDWLAVEFRESGWNVKQMFRLLVTSATYRQAATTTPEKLQKDRDNRLLSRGPRFRMDAEMIRDYALAASGTLSPKMGGPGTKPYQPEGLWDIVGLPGGNTRDYQQDHGDNLYRRSVYTFWKRMAPPPNMETFNAPSREFSCLRRERTNTPLQALITLNDPQFVEASRNLAQTVLRKNGSDPAKCLDMAARRVLCRPLKANESKVLEPALAELLSYYRDHSSDAQALVTVGETRPDTELDMAALAAWTNVCNMLLNLDEVLNK